MERDTSAYLFDIKHACDEILEFTADMSFEEYSGNSLVRAGVERKFLVISEAMRRLQRERPDILSRISNLECGALRRFV